jgi:hypothetical protein
MVPVLKRAAAGFVVVDEIGAGLPPAPVTTSGIGGLMSMCDGPR